jgi:hypothetical protein
MMLRRRNRDAEPEIDPKISIAMAGFQSPDHISNINEPDNVLDAVVLATTQMVVTIVNSDTMWHTIAYGNLQRRTKRYSTSISLGSFIAKSRRRKEHT